MNTFNTCPCCSTPLLHHFGNHREYWFCRHCWQEIPQLRINWRKNRTEIDTINLSELPIDDRLILAN